MFNILLCSHITLGKKGNPGLKGKLIEKSIEAYVASLEKINQLSIKYRVEIFAYLICNAWELLLKAKLIEDNRSNKVIYYPKRRRQPRRSISISDAIKRTFINDNDPIRCNLERVIGLRDEAVHLVIDKVPKDILGLFQACVLNYHKCLNQWFKISLSDIVPVGMMTIVYDFNPEEFDLETAAFRKQINRDTFTYLSKLQKEIAEEARELSNPVEYSIDVSYTLALVKQPSSGDIVLSRGESGEPLGYVEIAKDSSKTHPFRRCEVMPQIKEKLDANTSFTQYDWDCIIKVYKIRQRREYYYQGTVPGSPVQYSQQLIDWIINEYEKDRDFFAKTRAKALQMNRIKTT